MRLLNQYDSYTHKATQTQKELQKIYLANKRDDEVNVIFIKLEMIEAETKDSIKHEKQEEQEEHEEVDFDVLPEEEEEVEQEKEPIVQSEPKQKRTRAVPAKFGGPTNYKCPECGKNFETPSSMKLHRQLVHTSERNFSCPVS